MRNEEMGDEERIEIATRIRQARELSGLSQGQVAKRLDMHRPTISELEAGRRRVTAEELNKLAELFRVSVEWLLRGDSRTSSGEEDEILVAARQMSRWKDADLKRFNELLQLLRKSGRKPSK
jgi:transcriptional regulator with XRE-family HTH domain